MKLNYRIPLFITLIAASAGIGTVGVHASTDCQQLFHAYQQQLAKSLHHKRSPETLARWAAWNKAHPNYRPHPTPKESLAKIDFVCQVPMDNSAVAQDLPPVELPALLPAMTDIFTAPSQPNIIASNVVPPDTPLQSPPGDPAYPPVYYPGVPTIFGGGPNSQLTPPISPTPEPPSVILMMTAFGLLSGLVFWKRSRLDEQECQPALAHRRM
jgi:hypothetical protein